MSQLPPAIREFVNQQAEGVPLARLKQAAARLSEIYRAGGVTALAGPAPERTAAYLATRLPATYAAARHVFRQMAQFAPESLLDLGAGCGAAALAAQAQFPGLRRPTLIEEDRHLAAAGRAFIPNGDWHVRKLSAATLPESDFVVASYSLGELADGERNDLVDAAWRAARMALVVIEPGSKAGFAVVLKIRDHLVTSGGHIAAPCPNALPCPVANDDWCHFGARVERTVLHRRLKDGTLNYEDEKFSYVVVMKQPVTAPEARIIRRPIVQPGLVQLTLCGDGKATRRNVTKREKSAFRMARKADWGGGWAEVISSKTDPNQQA